jgi:cytochrome c oxidase cbb3-type subunit III
MSEEQNHNDKNHDYDGIKELNNGAPMWIIILFIVTIGFSMLYAIHYFGYPGNGKDQASEYDSSVVQAQREMAVLQKKSLNNGSKMSDTEMSEKGAKLFSDKGCIACHGTKGEGNNIGPNLTDNTWIHGCSQTDMEKIISEGNPAKGMLSFKTTLSNDEIAMVATFIRKKLAGSNPANAKAPQGVECK